MTDSSGWAKQQCHMCSRSFVVPIHNLPHEHGAQCPTRRARGSLASQPLLNLPCRQKPLLQYTVRQAPEVAQNCGADNLLVFSQRIRTDRSMRPPDSHQLSSRVGVSLQRSAQMLQLPIKELAAHKYARHGRLKFSLCLVSVSCGDISTYVSSSGRPSVQVYHLHLPSNVPYRPETQVRLRPLTLHGKLYSPVLAAKVI